MPSSRLRLVARWPSNRLCRPTTKTSSTSLKTSAIEPAISPSLLPVETLGNKLQRLAFLSPEHLAHIENQVDRILRSLAEPDKGRWLYALALMVLSN